MTTVSVREFPWYAVHKETRFPVAGFCDAHDAEKFCKMFSHGMYIPCLATDLPKKDA